MKQLNRYSFFLLLVVLGQSANIHAMEEFCSLGTNLINYECDNETTLNESKYQREFAVLFETNVVKKNPSNFIEYLNDFGNDDTKKNKPKKYFEYIADYKYEKSWFPLVKCSLFEECLYRQNICAITLLTSHGANINKRIDLHTPLTFACKNSLYSIAMALIDSGADVNLPDNNNYELDDKKLIKCPLHHLVEHSDLNALTVAEKLIAHRADVNAQGYENVSPLNFAARSGNFPMIQLFLMQAEVKTETISSALQVPNIQLKVIIENLLTTALTLKNNTKQTLQIPTALESKADTSDDWSWKDDF